MPAPTNLDAIAAAPLPEIHSLGLMLFDPVWAERAHIPQYSETLHLTAGEMTLELEDRSIAAGVGDTLLVPPGAKHRDAFDLDTGVEILFCTWSWPVEQAYFALVPSDALLGLPAQERAELTALFGELRAQLRGESPVDALIARGRLQLILLHGLRRALGGVDEEQLTYGQARRRALHAEAIAYLEAHLDGCIALREVAEHLGVSTYYLSRVFSEESGFTLFQYLTTLRIEKAKELLRQRGVAVAEVAAQVGYESANYFSKVFRKHCGVSPRDFQTA